MTFKRTFSEEKIEPWQECTSDADLSEDELDPIEERLEEILAELEELKKLLNELIPKSKPSSWTGLSQL